MFETTHDHAIRGAPDATLREPRSGFSGFGGRPSLHPAWRDQHTGQVDARVTSKLSPSLRQARSIVRR